MKSDLAFIQRTLVPGGGNEAFALRFLNELAKRGMRVTLFAHRVAPELKERFECIHVPVFKPSSFLKNLSFAWFCKRLVREHEFDLILSNERTPWQNVYFAGEGCHEEWLKQRLKQVSAWKRWLIRINPLHFLLHLLEKKCLTNARLDGVIAFSERTRKELLQKYNLPEDKIRVVYHSTLEPRPDDELPDRAQLRKDWGVPENKLVILFVGSGFERKGLRFLIESLPHLKSQEYSLWVLGKGNIRPYKRLAIRLGVSENIRFFGQNPHADLFYRAGDVFVLPTLYEPFGLTVLEAMSQGLPVVVSSHAGASEIISHGENGLVIQDPFSPSEIAECLNGLFEAGKRNSLGVRGRDRAKEFSLQRQVDETFKALDHFKQSRKSGGMD